MPSLPNTSFALLLAFDDAALLFPTIALSFLLFKALTFRSAQDLPESPPHSNQAIRPAEGYPSLPDSHPLPFLSTSWREKYECILRTVDGERFLRFLMSLARATPISVPPLPYSARSARPRSALDAIDSVGFKSISDMI